MVYTTMELGTNYSNNKRKIMKELEIIQKRKVVRDYITERFQKQYYGDFNPSEWFSKSTYLINLKRLQTFQMLCSKYHSPLDNVLLGQ